MVFNLSLALLPVFGFLIGLFVTIVGGGGGVFYVPVLTLFFGVPTQLAVATSLASVLPTTITGAISHNRLGNVNARIGVIFGAGGVVGTLLGAYIATMIPSALLKKIFGLFLLVLTIPMVLNALKRRERSYTEGSAVLTGSKKFAGSLFGVASGTMAGLFGDKRNTSCYRRFVSSWTACNGCCGNFHLRTYIQRCVRPCRILHAWTV